MTTATIECASGGLRGREENGVLSYKGIPFAQAPIGPRRFRAPRPVEPWTGVKDASAYGSIAPQDSDPLTSLIPGTKWLFHQPQADQSEDCLYLNVWAPSQTGRKAVLVWIHGGAFVGGSGSSPWLDGTNLARAENIVVVTINYRLGMLGSMLLDDADAPHGYVCNTGLLDQIAALRWIKENITSFGGDPDRVCIAGSSAGGMSIATLLATPDARGLFSRAIVQSGHAALLDTPDIARWQAARALSRLGIRNDQNALRALAALDTSALLEVQRWFAKERAVPFRFVADGGYVPSRPLEAIATAPEASVSVLMGTNRDETKLFRAVTGATPGSLLDRNLGDPRAVAVRNDLERDGISPDDAWDIVATDVDWRGPSRALADACVASSKTVYKYEFCWPTLAAGGALGACHALETPFVFNNLGARGVDEFIQFQPERAAGATSLADSMGHLWATFARDGSPNDANQADSWPSYEPLNRFQLNLDDDNTAVSDPHGTRLQRLEPLWSKDR